MAIVLADAAVRILEALGIVDFFFCELRHALYFFSFGAKIVAALSLIRFLNSSANLSNVAFVEVEMEVTISKYDGGGSM